MAKSYQEFKNMVLGKRYDVDRYAEFQCWDGYAIKCQYDGVPFSYCTATGYVKDIWNQRHTNGMLKYYNEVAVMQPGDICVFTENVYTPYSHIAIFDSDCGNGWGRFLGQNQGGAGGAFNVVELPYSATFPTAFRLKNQPAPAPHKIGYQAHVQNDGWQSPKYDGATAGTTGKSLRMEAFRIFTQDGTIVNQVSVYAKDKGWLTTNNPGKDSIIGTTGQSRALYSVKIKTSKKCYFRIHRQDYGWSNWFICDGKEKINPKDGKRVEAIEIKRG